MSEKHPATLSDNYVPQLASAVADYSVPGHAHVATVIHKGWCDLLNTRGFCNCVADFDLECLVDGCPPVHIEGAE